MSNLIFILKDGPFGDCTSRYELGFRTPMTVEEFIKEVLSQNERGCIYIDDRCINYSKDRVLSGQWEDIKDCEVFPISAGGGWGLMDYRVTIKKKKKEYPKTYEECCAELNYLPFTDEVVGYKWDLIQTFQQLLICRDAYWEIAGEEMGLSGSWKPDFASCKIKYAITYYNNALSRYNEVEYSNTVLVFPTAEVRDAFYENFKELIESTKELL